MLCFCHLCVYWYLGEVHVLFSWPNVDYFVFCRAIVFLLYKCREYADLLITCSGHLVQRLLSGYTAIFRVYMCCIRP